MTPKEVARLATGKIWDEVLDKGCSLSPDDFGAIEKIVEAAIRQAHIRTRHDGDCSIFACREGSDCLEQGICCCGFGHQNHWHGGEPEMYSNELLKMIDAKSAKGGEHD